MIKLQRICPLCNKLQNISIECDKCGKFMINLGRVQDFSDPYGPQDPINDGEGYCIHLFNCKNCNNRKKSKIWKIEI